MVRNLRKFKVNITKKRGTQTNLLTPKTKRTFQIGQYLEIRFRRFSHLFFCVWSKTNTTTNSFVCNKREKIRSQRQILWSNNKVKTEIEWKSLKERKEMCSQLQITKNKHKNAV